MQPTEAVQQGASQASEAHTPQIAERASSVLHNLTDGDVTSADLMQAWTDLGWPVVKAILLLVAVLMVSRWLGGMTRRVLTRAHVEITLANFFANMARWGVIVLGALAILNTFGVETTSFAAVIAAVGFAIGMALSGTLANFASGVMLLIFRPFKVGDVVNAAGVMGKISAIELFSTTFDTVDNRRIIVPNSKIYGDIIENVTHHDTRRVDVNVGVAYGADVDKAREVLEGVSRSVQGGLQDPTPAVYLNALGDNSVNFVLRVWSKTSDYWDVRERLTRDAKKALDAAKIGIPFPQRDVNFPGEVKVRIARD
ncbi:MAG: mechanosensitive ion channel [Phycisphaerales bacterium]|jgi:small conductance mechanosensitive channel|nr:mechanosensitive ion channel [Phycisphaerales bacterium]